MIARFHGLSEKNLIGESAFHIVLKSSVQRFFRGKRGQLIGGAVFIGIVLFGLKTGFHRADGQKSQDDHNKTDVKNTTQTLRFTRFHHRETQSFPINIYQQTEFSLSYPIPKVNKRQNSTSMPIAGAAATRDKRKKRTHPEGIRDKKSRSGADRDVFI